MTATATTTPRVGLKMKCCPFCGTYGFVEVAYVGTPRICTIRCAGCGAEGPDSATIDDAIANWNRRLETR